MQKANFNTGVALSAARTPIASVFDSQIFPYSMMVPMHFYCIYTERTYMGIPNTPKKCITRAPIKKYNITSYNNNEKKSANVRPKNMHMHMSEHTSVYYTQKRFHALKLHVTRTRTQCAQRTHIGVAVTQLN